MAKKTTRKTSRTPASSTPGKPRSTDNATIANLERLGSTVAKVSVSVKDPIVDVPTRTLAPDIANAAAGLLDGSLTLHLSGCAKGCAHLGPTALTVVGTEGRCGIVLDGAARDRPVVTLAPEALGSSLTRLAQACVSKRLPGESTAAVLSRFGHQRIAAILSGEPA